MANQRQRLARKRFRASHPELFPKPEPTPPNPDKKKKPLKRKRAESKALNVTKKTFKKRVKGKHPLRVPGMKPGDHCFICKEKDHIAKFCPQKAEWEKNKICLRCRRRGHRAQNCPDEASNCNKLCYNCGETGHTLDKCPQPLQDGGTKFAICFVCNGQGHLSKDCPQNVHGIYPKGGCCKICSGVTHLAKDCPEKGNRGSVAANGVVKIPTDAKARPRGQVTKLVSGDDLEDDFITEARDNGDKNESSKPKNSEVKQKKKGPKVVNFKG